MNLVITSMFGDPLHRGHLECLELAKKQGDYLLVLVDSDRKAIEKKGFVFIPENERLKLIQSLKFVDEARIVDTPIAEALEEYHDCIFAKGGDRTIDNLPKDEIDICNRNNIKIVCGLGDKVQSSSNLIDNTAVQKPWGKYTVIHKGINYLTKIISVNPKQRLSLQSHSYRDEFWTVIKGSITATHGNKTMTLKEGDSLYIPAFCVHRIANMEDKIAEIMEVQLGKCDEDDIFRFEDDYERK